MKKLIEFCFLIGILLTLSACHSRKDKARETTALSGDTIAMKYAEHLILVKYDHYTTATLLNPWKKGKILHTYILTEKQEQQPEVWPEGTLVSVPLTRSLVYSSVHCSLLNDLNAADAIKGVCDLSYISLPFIQEKYRLGKLTDAGNSNNPDIEKIIQLMPDAILLSPYDQNNGYGKIEKLNIPIIECADYMETSALGRAEWIKWFGLLFGKQAEADSIFNQTEKEYLMLKKLTAQISNRPSVINDLKIGNTWYVAGGNSTPGKLFADAGANYLFAHTTETATIPMPFESVFDQGQQADFWLIKYNQAKDKTYHELKKEYSPYSKFKAYASRKIYGCNTRRIAFYEETPFHPEKILKDLVKIFHPELLPDYQLNYYTPLSE